MDFIRANRDRPWLCIAGFYSPHSPWIAPQTFLDAYDPASLSLPAFPPEVEARRAGLPAFSDQALRAARHGYYAMVSEVDHHCRRLLDLLDQLALARETMVVYTTDHGDWLGSHLRHGKGFPAPDAVSRVPLVVGWPAEIHQPGRIITGLTEAVDVLPTLLECAGVPVPPAVQGRSLLPVLHGQADIGRDSALTEGNGWKALRTDRYRYVCDVRAGEVREHLWDVLADPDEYVDLAASPRSAPILADLRRLDLARLVAQEQPLPRVWPY
jgi:arylsulfatase A-like enzyme